MTKPQVLHDASGVITEIPNVGIVSAYGTAVPANGVQGYAPGCRFIKIDGNSIGTVSYINIGTRTSAAFVAEGLGGLISVSYVFGDAAPADGPFFVADRALVVQSIYVRITVAGSDAGAVTAAVKKANSTVSLTTGAQLHSGTINLKGTADVNQILSVTAGNAAIPDRWCIGLDVTGVTTAARGVISMILQPA